MRFWRRWTEYRRAQRDRMAGLRGPHRSAFDPRVLGGDERLQPVPEPARDRESRVPQEPLRDERFREESSREESPREERPRDEQDGKLLASALPLGDPNEQRPRRSSRGDYGSAGTPFNRQSPFYVGFVGAIGVLTAYAVVQAIGRLDTTITLLVVSLFLTLALNPLVEGLSRRGLRRGIGVAIVFVGLLGVFTLLGMVVIPPVAAQGTDLGENVPGMLEDLLRNHWVQDLDHRYQVIQRIQQEINDRVADGNLWAGIFGGVLDAGKIIAAGVFSVLTVLVLTLYFLASLPSVKQAAYALVPASRRPRFISLAEEIMRRVGSYAIGQVAVAATNAFFAWIMMNLLDLQFAAVLAVAVGLLGLIPMIGATLGASVVALVAFFDEPKKALIVIIYFIIYQQLENYAVMPRIMQQTVAVPGALTVVAALAGGTLLGILGALIAIPFAAGALLIYEEVLVPRQRQH